MRKFVLLMGVFGFLVGTSPSVTAVEDSIDWVLIMEMSKRMDQTKQIHTNTVKQEESPTSNESKKEEGIEHKRSAYKAWYELQAEDVMSY